MNPATGVGLALLAALAVACEREAPLEVRVPARLAPRPALADPSCEALARAVPTAAWQELGPLSARLMVTDPSVLGGPFAAPLRIEGGVASARALVEPSSNGPRLHCVQVRLAEGSPSAWKSEASVGIDSGMLLLGDEAALLAALRPARAQAVPCAEAPAADLEQAVPLLRARGLELTPVLPTLACAERDVQPSDHALITGLLREIKSDGRFLIEPRMAAWSVLSALGGRPWAPVSGPDGKPAGFVLDISSGDGLYPVRVGHDAGGKPLLVEIPLR